MNENLVCRQVEPSNAETSTTRKQAHCGGGTSNCGSRVLARVPDLISLVDADRFTPVLVEELRYGLRVRVLTFPAHPLLRTPTALRVVGPTAFGYESEPSEQQPRDGDAESNSRFEYREPLSVFEEFSQSSRQ